MAKKIGELLVEKRLITRSQLARALQSQLISGGHLGTCLIELGFTDVESLGETLADALHMRYARPEMFHGIPSWVIETLSAEDVEKYQVVPIGKEDRSLHLAVISAKRLSTLSSRTGYKIVPWIAPEVRVLEAMERYYDIPRRARYLTLSQAVNGPASSARDRRGFPPARTIPALSPSEKAVIHHSPSTAVLTKRSPRPPADLSEVPSIVPSASRTATQLATAAALAPAAVEDPTPEESRGLAEVARQMSRAEDREELASVITGFAARHMPRCILLGVKSGAAYVWDWNGIDLNPTTVSEMKLPLIGGSIFELLEGDDIYWGEVPGDGRYDAFYSALGSSAPEEALLLPIYLNDRLVATLYGEGTGVTPIGGDAETWGRLADKISMSLNMIVLKMKIRSA